MGGHGEEHSETGQRRTDILIEETEKRRKKEEALWGFRREQIKNSHAILKLFIFFFPSILAPSILIFKIEA